MTQGMRTAALIIVLGVLLAACGTRASQSRFEALVGGGAETGAAAGAAGGDTTTTVGGSGTAAPTGGDTTGGGGARAASGSTRAGTGGPGGASRSGGTAGGTTGTSDSGADGQSGGSTASGGSGGGPSGGGDANQASDVGVTADTIKVGNIVSLSGPLGPNTFGPMYFGANAYFEFLNANGGVNGRTIEFIRCDDAEDPSRNQECAQKLVEDEQVFAMVANATRAYSAAEYVSNNGVPDILGQPIGNAYWTYPGFFAVRGSEYDNDGNVGYKGRLYGSTLQFQYFKQNFDLSRAGVVYYNVPVSKVTGQFLAEGLREQGIEAVEYEVNPGLPNWDSVVADMQSQGVEAIWDTIDVNGNRNLCKAMQRNSFGVKVKATTSQGMGRGVSRYSEICRPSVFAITEAVPYSSPAGGAERFRRVMRQVYGDRFSDSLAQWAWEGWLAARSFTEAVRSMGATPTRKKLIAFYRNVQDHTLGGLFTPLQWTRIDFDSQRQVQACLVVSRWNEQAGDFERVSDNPYCDAVRFLPYEPA